MMTRVFAGAGGGGEHSWPGPCLSCLLSYLLSSSRPSCTTACSHLCQGGHARADMLPFCPAAVF